MKCRILVEFEVKARDEEAAQDILTEQIEHMLETSNDEKTTRLVKMEPKKS